MTGKTGLWMYSIINAGESPLLEGLLGINGISPVFVVSQGKFAAVVSEEPMKKYPLMRDYLMAHQMVNERVLETHRVLPVKFCTIAADKERIIDDVLIPKTEEFKSGFRRIKDCDEFGLRVRWKDLDKVFREIGESDEDIKKRKAVILSLPEAKRRSELIEIGHMVQGAVQRKNTEKAKSLMNELSPVACELRENKVLGDAAILNAAFLVEKKNQKVFDQIVESIDTRFDEELQFKYVGPVPPFNFVEIVIEWKRGLEPERTTLEGSRDAR